MIWNSGSALPHSCISSFSFFSTSSTKAGKPASSRQRRSNASRPPEGSVFWWYAIGRVSSHSPRKNWRGRDYNAWKSQCALHGWHLRGQIRISLTASNSASQHQIQAFSVIMVPEKGVWLTALPWQRQGPPVVHLQGPEVETRIDSFIIVSGLTSRSILSLLIEYPHPWESFSSLPRGDDVTNHILQREFPLCLCSLSLEPQVCVFTFQIHK